jgi:hypothetical protein
MERGRPVVHCGKAKAKFGRFSKSIDRREWMREQMLTVQRLLERVELNNRGRQIQRRTTRLKN